MVLALVGATVSSTFGDSFVVPRLSGPVVDNAGIIRGDVKAKLEGALRYLKSQGGSQIQVLTVKDLGGLPIEQASIQVVDKWKLGSETKDNGVLLLISNKDRKMRIEVGQGLEGNLTDAHSKRIIEEVMVPLFRSGDKNYGILLGVFNIAMKTDPGIDLKGYLQGAAGMQKRSRGGKYGKKGMGSLGFILLILLFSFSRMGFFGFLGLGMGSRMLGGRGGGSFGGGGWSGGGGGFSGGGASGGW